MMSKPQYLAGRTGGKAIRITRITSKLPEIDFGTFGSVSGHSGRPRGYALLLAMLITSAVLSGAVALANIVISEIRQTRDVSSSIKAQYAAESAIERALFILRKGDYDLLISEKNPPYNVELASPVQDFAIAENDFVSLPIGPGVSPTDMSIINWEPDIDCQPSAESWIEISTVSWNSGATDPFTTTRYQYSYNNFLNKDIPPLNLASYTTEVRVRALYCGISKLKTDLPTRVVIRASAQESGVSQTAEAVVPLFAPAVGFADFVIFSEEQVTKGL